MTPAPGTRDGSSETLLCMITIGRLRSNAIPVLWIPMLFPYRLFLLYCFVVSASGAGMIFVSTGAALSVLTLVPVKGKVVTEEAGSNSMAMA